MNWDSSVKGQGTAYFVNDPYDAFVTWKHCKLERKEECINWIDETEIENCASDVYLESLSYLNSQGLMIEKKSWNIT